MRVLRFTLAATLFATMGSSYDAQATEPGQFVEPLLLRNGDNAGETNRQNRDNSPIGREQALDQVGAGQEQAEMAQLASGEIMMFGMGSYANITPFNGQVPNTIQGLCTSITMDPAEGPKMNVMKYVTNNNGDRDRNFNHPRVQSIFNGEAVAVEYNYAENNHAETYVMVFGPGCEQLSQPTKIMAKNNDNCSENRDAPLVISQSATKARLFGQYGCNGNGRDDSWVAGYNVVKNENGNGLNSYDVNKEYDISVEDNEERSRGHVMLTGEPDFAVACWTAGNAQPPNKGVRCAGINTAENVNNNQRLLWREYVAQYENATKTYRTEIRTTSLLDAEGAPSPLIFSTYQESVGGRRNREDKGNQQLMGMMLRATPEGLEKVTNVQTGLFNTGDPTHGEMCNTMWGTTGSEEPRALALSTSFNASTSSTAQLRLLRWDESDKKMVAERTIATGAAIDNQWISNIYGNNPNTQGRNFSQCVGNIANPGYGVEGGYLSDVKTFVGIPATTRRVREGELIYPEDKLATELVLIPAVVDAAPVADPGTGGADPGVDDDGPAPGDDDAGNDNGGTGSSDPAPGNGTASKTGGCNSGGATTGFASMLMLLGLGFLVGRRRQS